MSSVNPYSYSTYGLQSYLETSQEIAERTERNAYLVFARMLLVKTLYGLSAFEYGLCDMHRRPLRALREYRTKKQTTALFLKINPVVDRPKVEDKLLFHWQCQDFALPTPKLLAVLSSRQVGRDKDVPILPDFSSLLSRFNAEVRLDVILKPRNDAHGTGVRFVSFQGTKQFDLEGRHLDIAKFADDLHYDMQRDDYLVQSFVRPHQTIAALGSGKALGTLRIMTFVKEGRVRILYALLKIPSAGNVYDSFGAGASGNLIACVDLETGRLSPAWGRRQQKNSRLLESFDTNPTTGAAIRDVRLPEWAATCEVVERAAKAFHELPCLGWDIALSADGIVVMEANSNPDIVGAQACFEKGAQELLRPMLLQLST